MNRDHLKGEWTQLKGLVREKWGKLTDDDLAVIAGRRDQLIGTLQKRYGTARELVEEQVREWEAQFAGR